MNRRLLTSLAGAVLAIAIGLLPAIPAAGAKPRPKANLVVSRAKVLGDKYAYAGDTVEIRVSDLVENEGDAGAGASVNELTIRHKGASTLKDLTRKVPSLKKHEQSGGVGSASIAIPADAKLGKYEGFVCADARGAVRERNELDNCESLGAFYIAKRSWRGSISGSYSDENGINESWSSSDAAIAGPNYKGSGLFTYGFEGSVAYHDSGVGDGCAYSGAGVDGAPLGYTAINYKIGTYGSSVAHNPDFSYPIFCGSSIFNSGAPISGNALEIGFPSGQGRPLPFGTDKLAGSQAGIVDPTSSYTWNLK